MFVSSGDRVEFPSEIGQATTDSGNGIRPGEFLKGINVHAPESRDHTLELIDFLKGTPVEWVRIHPLPSRRIKDKNRDGVSYLDAIEKFAIAGYSLILPIDVGVKENVGVVVEGSLRRFVDESYSASYKAVKLIETRVSRYKQVRVIYGVENEIDTKEWILQSLPTVGWRETPLAWFALSADRELKYRRLKNIHEGIRDAAPDRATMANFEADDPRDDWTTPMSFIQASQTVLSKLGLIERDAGIRMNNYRIDIALALRKLSIDIIGLDNYPNYFSKVPPKGGEIGRKVNEIAKKTKKPIINAEFGYTAHESFWASTRRTLLSEPRESLSLEEHQRRFYQNALGSLESSVTQGTFPWVLMLDPARNYRPLEENGFTLLKFGFNGNLEPTPALTYYLKWLEKTIPQDGEERIRDLNKVSLTMEGNRETSHESESL